MAFQSIGLSKGSFFIIIIAIARTCINDSLMVSRFFPISHDENQLELDTYINAFVDVKAPASYVLLGIDKPVVNDESSHFKHVPTSIPL